VRAPCQRSSIWSVISERCGPHRRHGGRYPVPPTLISGVGWIACGWPQEGRDCSAREPFPARCGALGFDESARDAVTCRRCASDAATAPRTQLARGVTSGWASQIERGELAAIDAVARCAEALGGRLDLIASLGDDTLTVATTEAA
jgi:hypothetical protein